MKDDRRVGHYEIAKFDRLLPLASHHQQGERFIDDIIAGYERLVQIVKPLKVPRMLRILGDEDRKPDARVDEYHGQFP
jgi:hypothetical protein